MITWIMLSALLQTSGATFLDFCFKSLRLGPHLYGSIPDN